MLLDALSPQFYTVGKRVLLIILVAIAAHVLVLLIRKAHKLIYHKKSIISTSKTFTITSLFTSILVFTIYFLAIGFALKELGISLTAYIASASVIGLAVGFGTQGIVQDIITGFTLIISNQINVGDLVEINGQTGIVRSISMRFVIFENAMGAEVFIPNRNINLVINYPKKYINCNVDIILPSKTELIKDAKEKIGDLVKVVTAKYPRIFISTKPKIKSLKLNVTNETLRLIFQIWPSRGIPIETSFRQEIIRMLKNIDPDYEDWMVSVHYEVENNVVRVKKADKP